MYLHKFSFNDDLHHSISCILFPQFPLGFSTAANVRVGNALGAGNIEQAKLSCKVPIVCACKNQSIQHMLIPLELESDESNKNTYFYFNSGCS